jgi:hypothetical protein
MSIGEIKMNIHIHRFFADSGHGWLEVPMDELRTMGLIDSISRYSYRSGNTYLEEDCDAGLFITAKENLGMKVQLEEKHVDGDSFVRTLPRYY